MEIIIGILDALSIILIMLMFLHFILIAIKCTEELKEEYRSKK